MYTLYLPFRRSLAALTVLTTLGITQTVTAIETHNNLPDTGQNSCYNERGTAITCPDEGTTTYGQDAQYSGNAMSYTNNGDGTVTDNVTGIVWQKSPDVNGDGSIDANDKLSYSAAISYCNNLDLAGENDWQLPHITQLYSLIHFEGKDASNYTGTDTSGLEPFIDTDYFDFEYGDTSAGDRIIDVQYASSTLYVSTTMGGNETMFGVNFGDGRIKGYPTFNKTYYLLCARNLGNYGQANYTDNGDGTITEQTSGLMWAQNDSGTGMTWEEALAWAEQQNAANYLGYNDWRLPNAKELQSLVDYTRSPDTHGTAAINGLFNATAITNEAGQTDYPYYWSSTSHLTLNDHAPAINAAYVSFGRAMGYWSNTWQDVHGAGAQRADPKTGNAADYPQTHGPQGDVQRVFNYARLVRDSQSTSPDTPTETTPVAGFAGALDFSQGGYVELPFIFDPATQPQFTAELWFYTESAATVQSLLSQRYGTGTGRDWLYIGSSNGGVLATLFGGTWLSSLNFGTLSTHTWHHAALVYDNGTMSLYLDGELAETASVTPEASDGTLVLNKNSTLNGMMDEVRIWGVARTQQQIRHNMNLGLKGTEPDLLAYYTFDEADGTTLTDRSNQTHNGTLNDSLSWVTLRPGYFDGVDDYIDTGSQATELGTADFTLEAWVKTNAVDTAQAILSSNDGDSTWERGEKSFYLNQNGIVSFVGYGNEYIRGTTAVNDGQWHHVAVTWNVDGSAGNIYVDGVLDTNSSTNYVANNANNAGDTFKIGRPNYQEAPAYFHGQIDSLRVWNRPLSETEVQTYMTQVPDTSATGLVASYPVTQPSELDETVSIHGEPLWPAILTNTTVAGGQTTGQLPGVNDTFTYQLVQNGKLGEVVLNENGNFSYTATDTSATGYDRFTYTLSNGTEEDNGMVTLNLAGLNPGGETGGSSTGGGVDLLEQLPRENIDGNCTPHNYPVISEQRLAAYNKMAGITLVQNPQHGGLETNLEAGRFALGITDLNPNGGAGTQVHLLPEAQAVLFQTQEESLLTHPVIQAPCALKHALAALDIEEFTVDEQGRIIVPVGEAAWFYFKPDWQAQPLMTVEGTLPRLRIEPPGHVYLEFEDKMGKWQQRLHPAMAQPNALESLNLSIAEGSTVAAGLYGRLQFTIDGEKRLAIPEFLVVQDVNPEGVLKVEQFNETSGFSILYADGKRQVFSWLP